MNASPQLQRRFAELGLVYAAAVWGSTFFIVKDVVRTMHPQVLVGWRFILSAALLLPVVVWRAAQRRRQPGPVMRLSPAAAWLPGLGIGLVLWLLYATQTAGIVYTTASNSGFITGLFIVFVPLLSWLAFRQRPGAGQLLAIGVAVAGLALLTGGLSELNRGDALTLVSAVLYAWQVLLADRHVGAGLDPYLLCFQQFLVTGGLSLAAAALLHAPLALPHGRLLWELLFLTLFPTLSAFQIQLVAQRVVPPLRTALIFTLEPVFAALFAWTLGGEQFIPLRGVGGLLIVAAMLLAELPLPWGRRGKAAVNQA
jgi:drug/metabolite transporter (DMT)-like permease